MENQQDSNLKHEGNIQMLADKIKDVKLCMLATINEEGKIHSRPMYTQPIKEDGLIWFFIDIKSHKVDEIRKNPIVNLNYSDPGKDLFISASGVASVNQDKAKIDELWNPFLKAWFPEGKDDPSVALLKVDLDQAEIWDTPDTKISQLIGFVKATITGTEYHPGENVKINLK
ncbi:pyridoxamine 5'-phosphate oxidase family protein [Daejeonella oryzae]|uniref:pyridoxamine 5'-phosphate oxidase family protein n=1 Tax=Daejeonella oryzae TaxID=1122943 RepID=UPI0004008F77|nr:pyridoxamine 5'-phosphate oxidase family protein [Daejeonella oryzae]